MQQTNWRDFSIGMAAGVALTLVLYFAWGLIRPRHPDPVDAVAQGNVTTRVGMDENALIAANAEHPNNNVARPALAPEPQVEPAPRAEPEPRLDPEPGIDPDAPPPSPVRVTRPRPRPPVLDKPDADEPVDDEEDR